MNPDLRSQLQARFQHLKDNHNLDMGKIPDFQPHRIFTPEEERSIAKDTRSATVLGLVYGVTRTRIRAIKYKYSQRMQFK